MTATRRLALIAPLLGDRPERIPDVFERLGPLLAEQHEVVLSSTREGRVSRAVDMAVTVRRRRQSLDVVVIHLYSGRALAVEDLVSRVARRAGLAQVGVLSGGAFPEFHRRHPRWVRSVLGRFDALAAPSDHLGGWAAGLGFRTRIIANPLDVGDYAYRERTSIGPRLFWMRAFHPIYRPMIALDVIERVRRVHAGALLTMAGPDKGELGSVQREVARRGLTGAVDFRGFVGPEEKRELFDAHDVFLNTPEVDNRPVCLVEAAASGLAIVTTDAGGIPALVTDDESAVLAPVDDVDALAAGVMALIADPARARRIVAGGRRMAEQGSPDRVLASWNDLLDEIA